jgi:hypothetical protein
MMRSWFSLTVLIGLSAAAAPPFPFDPRAAIEMATTYLRSNAVWVEGRTLNYDKPQLFAAAGQVGRHFISVGFDSSGNAGGSFVVLEVCPKGGPVVVALPGAMQNFADYRGYVTQLISGSVVVPHACPK